jgi:hypothetical protein
MKNLTSPQLSTILAALRFYQDNAGPSDPSQLGEHIEDIATKGWTETPLTAAQVDELCEQLNFGDENEQDESPSVRDALERVARLLPYDDEDDSKWDGDNQLTTRRDGEDAMRVLNFHIANARKVLAPSPVPPPAGELLPDDFRLATTEGTASDADLSVPPAMLDHAGSAYATGEHTLVIGQFYGGEEYLLHLDEEVADHRDDYIADGWPARFMDFLISIHAGEGVQYLRITA